MKDAVIHQLLDVLKRKDIKDELKILCSPLITLFFNIINPYIYITLVLFFLIFILNLAILSVLLIILRNKSLVIK